jgi:hypothetical protein
MDFPGAESQGPLRDQMEVGQALIVAMSAVVFAECHGRFPWMAGRPGQPSGVCCPLQRADAWLLGEHRSTHLGASGPSRESHQPLLLFGQLGGVPSLSFRSHAAEPLTQIRAIRRLRP